MSSKGGQGANGRKCNIERPRSNSLRTPLCRDNSPDQEEAEAEKDEEPDSGENIAGATFFLQVKIEHEGLRTADLDLALEDDALS